jgi:excisionase family DNA binding protein
VKRTTRLASTVVTPTQASEIIDVSVDSVYALIHSGRLPAFRYLNRNWKIRRTDLDAFCARASNVPGGTG